FTLGWFFRLFNWAFKRGTAGYIRMVGVSLRGSLMVLILYGGLLGLTWWLYSRLPSGYIPNQDQGRYYVGFQLPDASSLERSQRAADHIADIIRPMDGMQHTTEIVGQSFTLNANGSNFGQFFVTLDSFDKRRDPSMHAFAITDRIKEVLDKEVPEAKVSL